MKKILLIATLGLTILSCKKDGESKEGASSDTVTEENVTLTEEEKLAAYAYGVTLGQSAERYNSNPELKDSLDIDEFQKGIEEFLDNSDELASYAYGMGMGQQIQGAVDNKLFAGHLDKDEILAGLMDYLRKNDLKVSADSTQILMDAFYQNRLKSSAELNAKRGIQFMNDIKQEAGVKTTESGIAYKVLKEGSGAKPSIGDKVKVKYTGATIDGKVFDSTDKNNKGEAIEFPLNPQGLIPGWIEGLQLMSKGAHYKFFIPSELGYGERGSGAAIAANETLIFDIELVDFTPGVGESAPAMPPAAPQHAQPGVNIKTK